MPTDPTNQPPTRDKWDDADDAAPASGGQPPADEDGPLDSLGKAITAPMRDDPGTDVDEKPEEQTTRPPRP